MTCKASMLRGFEELTWKIHQGSNIDDVTDGCLQSHKRKRKIDKQKAEKTLADALTGSRFWSKLGLQQPHLNCPKPPAHTALLVLQMRRLASAESWRITQQWIGTPGTTVHSTTYNRFIDHLQQRCIMSLSQQKGVMMRHEYSRMKGKLSLGNIGQPRDSGRRKDGATGPPPCGKPWRHMLYICYTWKLSLTRSHPKWQHQSIFNIDIHWFIDHY